MLPVCFIKFPGIGIGFIIVKILTKILFYFSGKITEICPNFYHMNRKLPCLLCIFCFLFRPLFSSAQMIDSMMKVYAEKYPQEKVYLQFDKKAYNPGRPDLV